MVHPIVRKPKAIIIDLDGTLCNAEHRLEHIQKTPKDWETFFSLSHLDQPNEWCLDLIQCLYESGRYEILFVTGRSERDRQMTFDWLVKHLPFIRQEHIWANLAMRGKEDRRPDHLVKGELYRDRLYPSYRVMMAIDDREDNTKLWRSLGIAALQCDDWEERDRAKGGTHAAEVQQFFMSKMDQEEN